MCNPLALFAVSTAMKAYSGYQQAQGQKAMGEAQGRYYDYQAKMNEMEGEYALKQGKMQSNLVQEQQKIKGRNLKTDQAKFNAEQIAEMASRGVTGVTAEDIVGSTMNEQFLDEEMLRYNADIKSWNIETDASYKKWSKSVEARQNRYAGEHARYAGKVNSRNTLLGTATSILSSAVDFWD